MFIHIKCACVADESSSDSECDSDGDSSCSSSSDSEVFDVIAEIKRKKAHPDRLHDELWYNDPGQVCVYTDTHRALADLHTNFRAHLPAYLLAYFPVWLHTCLLIEPLTFL